MPAFKGRLQKHWLLALLAVLVVYCTARFGFLAVQPPGMIPNDYAVYHDTCTRWDQGKPIYNPQDPSPFKYSPTFLVVFCSTVYQIGKVPSWPLFAGLSILLFAGAMHAMFAWSFGGIPGYRRLLPVLIPAGIFGWHGLLEQFSYGQIDFLMFSLFVAAAILAEQKREGLAALLMSCVLMTKPQMAIWVGYFLLVGNWRMITFTALATALVLAAPVFVFGPDRFLALLAEWRNGINQQSIEFMTGNLNQGLGAVVARLTNTRPSVFVYTNLFVALGAAITLVLAYLLRKGPALSKPRRARAFIWITLLYLVLCPISWRWLTFLWIPIAAVLAMDALSSRNKPQLAALLVFAVCGTLLQRIVANALGIPEVDELSGVGLYAAGNLALLVASSLGVRNSRIYTA